MQVKVPLCLDCAAKLRTIRDAHGEEAMIRAMGSTLCERCLAECNRSCGEPVDRPVTFIRGEKPS